MKTMINTKRNAPVSWVFVSFSSMYVYAWDEEMCLFLVCTTWNKLRGEKIIFYWWILGFGTCVAALYHNIAIISLCGCVKHCCNGSTLHYYHHPYVWNLWKENWELLCLSTRHTSKNNCNIYIIQRRTKFIR